MTAAIGPKVFDAPTMRPPADQATGKRQAEATGTPAFGDLVHDAGQRDTHRARLSTDDKGPALHPSSPSLDRTGNRDAGEAALADSVNGEHPQKAGRRLPHAGHDRPDDDREKRDDPPPAARVEGAPPLRDRIPLLVTLHGLDHRNAGGSAAATVDQPGGRTDAATILAAGTMSVAAASPKSAGEAGPVDPRSATLSAGLASIPRSADPAGRENITDVSPPDATASASNSAGPHDATAPTGQVRNVSRPAVAAAAMVSLAGRPAQRGAAQSEPSVPASKSAKDGIPGERPAAPAQKITVSPVGAQLSTRADPPDGSEYDEAGASRVARSTADRREIAPEAERTSRTGPDRPGSGSVAVTADRSFPAPAGHPLNSTTTSVIGALAAAQNQAVATPVSSPQPPPAVALQAHMLRIELHPAELGMVVANLRMTGDQLSVELRPETAEAYRRLSQDSDTIAKSLKNLGLDVDSVTVTQPSIAMTAAARTDAGNQTATMPGRDASQFQPGTSGGGGDNSGDRQSERRSGHEGQALERTTPAHSERVRGSLFI